MAEGDSPTRPITSLNPHNMSNYTAVGQLLKLGQTEQVSEKFRKRDLILSIAGEYPQTVAFQLTQDRCEKADTLKEGQTVTVHFNLRGREWTAADGKVKYFNTLEAWKVTTDVAEAPYILNTPVGHDPSRDASGQPLPQNGGDLPF